MFKRLLCVLLGHDFPAVGHYHPDVLIHCSRCGNELLGRTSADIEPISEEEREALEGYQP